MHRAVLLDCLPYLIGMIVGAAVLRLLLMLSGARCTPSMLWRLARDEQGSVQSLSFVMTVPVFIMILMFIVQLAQITMARLVVEYAAFAAARSAIVWIPASVPFEPPNHIGIRSEPTRRAGIDGREVDSHDVALSMAKGQRIRLAAASACLAICPSRRIEDPASVSPALIEALWNGYQATTPDDIDAPRRRNVLANKMAYAMRHTNVTLRVEHPITEPPLQRYYYWRRWWWWWYEEFHDDEIGWRDTLVVTVTHDYALLPGPGRLLATAVSDNDQVAARIHRPGRTYLYRLTATMSMDNEGQKSTRNYWHP